MTREEAPTNFFSSPFFLWVAFATACTHTHTECDTHFCLFEETFPSILFKSRIMGNFCTITSGCLPSCPSTYLPQMLWLLEEGRFLLSVCRRWDTPRGPKREGWSPTRSKKRSHHGSGEAVQGTLTAWHMFPSPDWCPTLACYWPFLPALPLMFTPVSRERESGNLLRVLHLVYTPWEGWCVWSGCTQHFWDFWGKPCLRSAFPKSERRGGCS